VFTAVLRARNIGAFKGETGRSSCSARRMNCKGVNGDPDDEVDLSERGLCPLGVDKEKDGKKGTLGSGVRGGSSRASGVSGVS
jgi:hypothetical protein